MCFRRVLEFLYLLFSEVVILKILGIPVTGCRWFSFGSYFFPDESPLNTHTENRSLHLTFNYILFRCSENFLNIVEPDYTIFSSRLQHKEVTMLILCSTLFVSRRLYLVKNYLFLPTESPTLTLESSTLVFGIFFRWESLVFRLRMSSLTVVQGSTLILNDVVSLITYGGQKNGKITLSDISTRIRTGWLYTNP